MSKEGWREVVWLGTQGGEVVTRRFRGVPDAETDTTIAVKYDRKALTLNKADVTIYDAKGNIQK